MDTIALVGLGWLAFYTLASAIWPYRRCSRCSGTGKRRSPGGRSWRDCGRCGGDGVQLRLGRRVAEWWSR